MRYLRALTSRPAAAVPRTALIATLLTLAAPPSVTPAAAQAGRTATPPATLAGASVPRFEISPSPIGLTGAVRPRQYVGVTGPRSAWLGFETGEAELWVHPLKVARDFELAFKVPQYRDPLAGRDVARTVEVRPEATTITYSHESFTVREHILAPRGEPGLLILLEVESVGPLDILVRFKPVLQYMWPGAFGGQYVFWDAQHRAFVLSESLQERNAVLGSPWATEASAHPAHRLSEAPSTFVIPVDRARAAREFIPIVLAAGIAPRDTVFAAYARILEHAADIYHANRARVDSVLARTTSLDTPDDSLDLALEWAKINLEEQRVCNPDLGCGLVAGWGPSGASTRPGFGWFFGGDAAINSLAMDATAQWAPVAEDLRFLARYQRNDGKIPHEISQSAARIDWFARYPYPYYHADTTPYWMLALWKYVQASGDVDTLRELWPAYLKAWAWCLSAETDGDGLIENTVGGYGAVEVGNLGEALHEDIYLASVWVEALQGTVALARIRHDTTLADTARTILATARATLNDRYWRPQDDQHAFAILESGRTNDNLTAWPATAASFGLLDAPRAERTLRKLATDSISADWGAHMLSTGSPLYDPLQYNQGTVWPFVTGFVSWGQYRYRRPWAGFHLIDGVKQITFDWSRGHHAELFSGRFYEPMDAAVPHQFFATSMLVTPLLRGMFGWAPDATHHRARLAPQLPPDWDRTRIRRLRVGATLLDVTLERSADSRRFTAVSHGPPVDLAVTLSIPLGAREVAGADSVSWGPHDGAAERTLHLTHGDSVTWRVTWNGGLTVVPPRIHLTPGQESRGVRVVDFTLEDGAWLLTLEGRSGHGYDLDLIGAPFIIDTAEGAVASVRFPAGYRGRSRMHVLFSGRSGRRSAVLRLRARKRAGA